MIQLADSDFDSLDTFSLRRRFVDRHGDVPAAVSSSVRPLTGPRASQLAALGATLCGDGAGFTVTFRGDDAPGVVGDRLRELPPVAATPIVLSWDTRTAVLTDWSLFTHRWNQFCHAASDDVAILPLDGAWCLCYRRADVFQFRSGPRRG